MRFSVWLSTGWSWSEVVSVAAASEAGGWDGIWVSDHFMPPEGGYGQEPDPAADPELAPVHEAWTLLSGLAALIPRVSLGVLVSGVSYRHPAVLAKMASTVDHISGGRLILGLGAGWQENEYRRYGIPYPDPRGRSDLLEEAAAVITALTGPNDRSTFAGTHYRLDRAPLSPRPIQQPLPLLIGGRGERRTLRTAARYASHWNVWGLPDTLAHKVDVLRAHCADIGRDPASISVSANAMFELCDTPGTAAQRRDAFGDRGGLVGTPDMLTEAAEAYRAAGVDEVVVAGFNHSATEFPTQLQRLAGILGR